MAACGLHPVSCSHLLGYVERGAPQAPQETRQAPTRRLTWQCMTWHIATLVRRGGGGGGGTWRAAIFYVAKHAIQLLSGVHGTLQLCLRIFLLGRMKTSQHIVIFLKTNANNHVNPPPPHPPTQPVLKAPIGKFASLGELDCAIYDMPREEGGGGGGRSLMQAAGRDVMHSWCAHLIL